MKARFTLPALFTLLVATFLTALRAGADETKPDSLAGLGLWLVASDLSAGHRDGQVLTTWPDRSGHGYDAVYEPRVPQAGLIEGLHNPPTFKTGAVGGQPAVSFNAANREGLILNRAGHALGQKTPGFTAVFLVRPTLTYGPKPTPTSAWTKNRYLFLTHVSDYNTRFSVQIEEGTGEVKLFSRAHPSQKRVTQTSSFDDAGKTALSGDAWHRVLCTVDYAKKTALIVLDGKVIERSLPADSASVSEDVPSPITGIGSTTLGDWLSCQIAEMACYNRALTAEELLSLDRYFTGKYQLKP